MGAKRLRRRGQDTGRAITSLSLADEHEQDTGSILEVVCELGNRDVERHTGKLGS